ncbi:MAG: DUF72 domain-containing protein [candidate division WOR-3 bacterium]
MRLRVGCCGFPVSRSRYYENFDLVEVQQVFYRFPDIKLIRRWRAEAPPDFEFTLKASQIITHPPKSPTYRRSGLNIEPRKEMDYGHFAGSEEVIAAWERTAEIGEVLGARVIVFQTPASFANCPDWEDRLRSFLSKIDRGGFSLGWEPRGNHDPERLRRVFEDTGLIHVIDPFRNAPLSSGTLYYRLHGRARGYRYDYSEDELRELAMMLKPRERSYILFNNTQMFKNALELRRILEDAFR